MKNADGKEVIIIVNGEVVEYSDENLDLMEGWISFDKDVLKCFSKESLVELFNKEKERMELLRNKKFNIEVLIKGEDDNSK
jgi:hypothetical protein